MAYQVFDIGKRAAGLDVSAILTNFTLKQIKSIVENIEKKVNIMMKAPLKKALQIFKTAINMVNSGQYDLAEEAFKEAVSDARMAFAYSKEQATDNKSFEVAAISLKLITFCHVSKITYSQREKRFYSSSPSNTCQEKPHQG